MQFFSLANSILREKDDCGAAIVSYAVVTLSLNAGLIAWVDGTDTFHQMVCDCRKSDKTVERSVIAEFISSELALLGELCRAEELFRLMLIRAPSASVWVKRTERFTGTTALMSMVGDVIGLCDRD
jgi:FKBP12-rapamycin complex-associated protein